MTTTTLDWKPAHEVVKKGWVIYMGVRGDSYSLGLQQFSDDGKIMSSSGWITKPHYAAQLVIPERLIEDVCKG
ncbi:hypothetical protein HW132_35250 [Brasilonema sp. CT11]|nr:hypothetical protein [Brasilonema sp. CT11]